MPSAKASLKAMAKEAKNKKKSATPKKTIKPVPAASFKSAEFVEESEEEVEEDKAQSDSDSDSDDDSLPENPADDKTKTNGKLPAPSGSSSSSENESGSNETSDDEEEEDQEDERRAAVVPEPSRHHPKESRARTVAFEKPPSYKPPTGFETAAISENSTASRLLKKSNLKGKQVWYFTAPASIPISKIEKLSMADLDAGKVALNYHEGDYGFVQDTTGDKIYTNIMVPSSADDAYFTASKPIDRILHLQQIVNLPGMSSAGTSISSSSRATVPAPKPVRQQPKGLMMRFRPIGFGPGETGRLGTPSSSGESDEEMEDAPAVFQRPVVDEEMEDTPAPTKSKNKSKNKSSSEPTSSHSKRKNTEGTESTKKSLSRPTENTDDRSLKKLKKKQKESRKSTADNRLASTEPTSTSANSHSHKAADAILTTPDLVSSSKRPSSSLPTEAKGSQESHPSTQKHSNKRSHESERSTDKKGDLPVQVTDPSLTGEERRKKIKKSKHKDSK